MFAEHTAAFKVGEIKKTDNIFLIEYKSTIPLSKFFRNCICYGKISNESIKKVLNGDRESFILKSLQECNNFWTFQIELDKWTIYGNWKHNNRIVMKCNALTPQELFWHFFEKTI